jgi:hypothetical protein
MKTAPGLNDHRRWWAAIALLFCASLCLSARAQAPNDGVVPTQPITLVNGESAHPFVRFTVGHAHLASYCWGYLDVSEDKITVHALTEAPHSFSIAHAGVTATPRFGQWVVIPTVGRNYDFLLVDAKYAGGAPSMRTAYDTRKSPAPIVEAVNNWQAYVTGLRAQLRPPAPPPAPAPVIETPKVLIASLRIRTSPGHVQVYLDGVFKGESSESGELVVEAPPGPHALRLAARDYKEWTQTMTFVAGQPIELPLALERSGPMPLSDSEVVEALSNGVAPARVAELVKKYGVSFTLTDEIEKNLRAKGADDNLLLVIAKNKR